MEDNEKRIADFKIPTLESSKWGTIQTVNVYLMKTSPEDAENLAEAFTKKYESLLHAHEQEDKTDLSRYYRLVMEFKPALASIMQPGKEFDEICDIVVSQFNVTLKRIRRQINEEKGGIPKKGPVLPGSSKEIDLKYFCTVCKQEFEIPPDMKTKLLNSSEKMELPKHHDKEMEIRIKRAPKKESLTKSESETKKIEIYSAELLMGHLDSTESKVEYLNILSVGIDVGSSTSHLVFSRLTLRRETSFFNMSNRFILVNREIIYEGNIILTPLIDRYTIDIEAIIKFCEEEYEKAGITPDMVDTGAVIVTGETAKKQNAEEIVSRLSS
ncbi:MAG: ethanolamine ammonia-lyase reactivating factor EutA, partial [Promethearchaeota archaeon]